MKALLRSGFLALALMAFAVPANAEPYEDGLAAEDRYDYAGALRLWLLLAEQGHAEAQRRLGDMYREGRGVPQDYAAAVKWYRLAAEQGHAYYSLGVMYRDGKGVPKDPILAHMWFNLAAVQMSSLGQVRDELAERMTPDQIADAQRMAREWMAKHQQ